MKWRKAYRHRYVTWEVVKHVIGKYYGDHYKLDMAFTRSMISNIQVLFQNTCMKLKDSLSMPK